MKILISLVLISSVKYSYALYQPDFKAYCENYEEIRDEYNRKLSVGLKFFNFEQRWSHVRKMLDKHCSFPKVRNSSAMVKEQFYYYVKDGLKDSESELERKVKRTLGRSLAYCETNVGELRRVLNSDRTQSLGMADREKFAIRYNKLIGFISSKVSELGLESACGTNLLQDELFDQVKVDGLSLMDMLNRYADIDVSDLLDQYLKLFKDKYNDSPKILSLLPKLKNLFKTYQNQSMVAEFDRLREYYSFLGRKEDVRPLVARMMVIARKLKSLEYEERVMRLPKWHSSIAENYIRKRRKSCSSVLLDNPSIQQNYDQGFSSTCYALSASNFINFHTLLGNVSGLYLFLLSLRDHHAFWTYLEDGIRSSNSDYQGGFVETVVNEFKRQKMYCTKETVRLGGKSLYLTIQQFESWWPDLLKGKEGHQSKSVSKSSFLYQLNAFMNRHRYFIKDHVPTLTPDELYTAVMKSEDKKSFLRNLIFGQCKSKVDPKLAKSLKVKAVYDFDNSRDDRIKIIDQQLTRKSVVTVQFNAGRLFYNDSSLWAPHVNLINGRQWNEQRKRCEYRMINTWGNSCEDLKNPLLTCQNGEIWVGETFLDRFLNSVTWSEQSPMMSAQDDPNYEDYDPDF